MNTDTPKIIHKIAVMLQILNWVCGLCMGYGMISTSLIVFWGLLYGDFFVSFPLWPLLVLGVLFYMGMIFLCKAQLSSHMVTSSDGLEYHSMGLHIRSSWENIERVKLTGIAAQFGIGVEVIALREPPEILSINWYGKQVLNSSKGCIPLLEFGQWRHTSLGNEIRKYAPKLLM